MIMNSFEVIRYLTVHMQGFKRTGKENVLQKVTATGFFAFLNINGVGTDIIITAKHFADEISRVVFILHYKENGKLITVPVSSEVQWNFSEDTDLAYCEFKPIEERFRKITGRSVYAAALTQKDILTEKQLKDINILDEVVMVGYPEGEASTHHKFPLFSKGYVASLPKDTVEDGEGFLNIPAIGGFSGAPVFLNTTGLKFLGVLVSGIMEEDSDSSVMCKYVPAYKILRLLEQQ